MKRLFCPWRIKYINAEKPKGCIFCTKPKENRDKENLILLRGKYNFVMLNLYPYNNGHLMIVPYKHTNDINLLESKELEEMMFLLQICVSALKEVMSPHGFNIGMNIGEVAGAGIAEHLHLHVVPRWNGDTNYMFVVGDTKVIPEDLETTYDKLFPVIHKIYAKSAKN
ncbi:MAG TPA: HIT domain-containing protein [Dictyoglomaceae bacterium]|nr:HIT domain-containing protein [Dictyoglomaceae bacterium]HOL39618.1 HIT domain-containing protein [Dictyoglomaceae bacterium]HOP95160.1 HIT domain-containing protein [Dictyoglomaceae bacterium]HPP15190.1 HIT domain-containing protein [Dictyoglomaceae bacterium]HPU42596.1 HIT domain-containing protein [Dictyoglomaceae bacterium]